MKRVLLLTLVAVVTFVLFAFIKNPELLNDIWIWLIGFAGLIIQTGKSLLEYFKSFFENSEQNTKNPQTQNSPQTGIPDAAQSAERSADVRMTLLRFHDDTQTSLGLLYVNDKFYCYTLEDTQREIKIEGETRIPAGTYQIELLQEETELTKKYRLQFPDWFTYHLHLKDVPGFTGIYIHNGGTHKDTKGCILVSDSLNISKDNTFLSNSKKTFELLYKFLTRQISEGKRLSITVRDETWFSIMNN